MIHRVGDRISSYRKERKMSQEELGVVLNVSRQTISKWETGDTLPDVYNVVALAQLFHVSLDKLILGAGFKNGDSSYTSTLKEKRRKINIRAIIIGSIGSITFFTTLVLLDAFGLERKTVGIVMACVFPFLALCWLYAIWNFVKIGRISDEIKYLQKLELTNIMNNPKNQIHNE